MNLFLSRSKILGDCSTLARIGTILALLLSNIHVREYFLNKWEGSGIPKLYVKFRWPLFLAMKFTYLFLNLAKIQILIPKSAYEGEGVRRFRNYS